MIAVVNFCPGWCVRHKAMKVNTLTLSVFADEGVSVKPETFATRIGIGDSPEANGKDALKIGAVNRNAKDKPVLGRAKQDSHFFPDNVAVRRLNFGAGN